MSLEDRVRDALRERARWVEADVDAWDRLESRLDARPPIRPRRHRLAAAVVALLVAAAGIGLGAFAFLRGEAPQVAGETEEAFLALWPERTPEEARAAQARVDEGADPWRLDPERTAAEFARRVLGWPDPQVRGSADAPDDPGEPVRVSVQKLPAPCPAPPAGEPVEPSCPGREIVVSVRQLVEGGGIWSVVEARSDEVGVPLSVGEVVEEGQSLVVEVLPPDGGIVHLKIPACGGWMLGDPDGGGPPGRDAPADAVDVWGRIGPIDDCDPLPGARAYAFFAVGVPSLAGTDPFEEEISLFGLTAVPVVYGPASAAESPAPEPAPERERRDPWPGGIFGHREVADLTGEFRWV